MFGLENASGVDGAVLVDEGEIEVHLSVMLLLGALAVAVHKVGTVREILVLQSVSVVILLGAATLVAGAVVVSSIRPLRSTGTPETSAVD